MACETIDLFTRRRMLPDPGRLRANELPPGADNKVLLMRDYRARRKAISNNDEAITHGTDCDNDEYEDFTLFP